MAQTIARILGRRSLLSAMRRLAYEYGRSMTWPRVGQSYWRLFNTVAPSVQVASTSVATAHVWKEPEYDRDAVYEPAPAV
jgi:hypothetical protein